MTYSHRFCDNGEGRCIVCGHAIAWHGCLGVSFCIACGGELRFFNEGSRNMYGQPVGTGGVVFP